MKKGDDVFDGKGHKFTIVDITSEAEGRLCGSRCVQALRHIESSECKVGDFVNILISQFGNICLQRIT